MVYNETTPLTKDITMTKIQIIRTNLVNLPGNAIAGVPLWSSNPTVWGKK